MTPGPKSAPTPSVPTSLDVRSQDGTVTATVTLDPEVF